MEAGKTAALLACAASIGAVSAGAPRRRGRRAWPATATSSGWPSSSIDDILGIVGDTSVTGKSSSSDMRAGKRSAPIVAALPSGDRRRRAARRAARAGGPPGTDADVTRATQLIDEAGGLDWATARPTRRLATALAHLETFGRGHRRRRRARPRSPATSWSATGDRTRQGPDRAHRRARRRRPRRTPASTSPRASTPTGGGRASCARTSRWTPRTCCCASSSASCSRTNSTPAARWIRSQQRADGTWANFEGGPGDLSTTIEAYAALRLAGDAADAAHMRAAREFVLGRRRHRGQPGVHPHLAGAVRRVVVGRPAGDAAGAGAAAHVGAAQRLRLGVLGPADRRPDHRRRDAAARCARCRSPWPNCAPACRPRRRKTGRGRGARSACSTGR